MIACCYCILCSNNTTKEDDGALPLSFSFLTQKEGNKFFRLNTTKEEGDGNKLPSLSLLQQHYRRRR
jgi:hypothetical protein